MNQHQTRIKLECVMRKWCLHLHGTKCFQVLLSCLHRRTHSSAARFHQNIVSNWTFRWNVRTGIATKPNATLGRFRDPWPLVLVLDTSWYIDTLCARLVSPVVAGHVPRQVGSQCPCRAQRHRKQNSRQIRWWSWFSLIDVLWCNALSARFLLRCTWHLCTFMISMASSQTLAVSTAMGDYISEDSAFCHQSWETEGECKNKNHSNFILSSFYI